MSEKKRGEAYIHSAEKRRFDLFVASSLLPVELGFRALARTQIPSGPVLLLQERMGANLTPFKLRKMRTLADDNETPLSPLMNKFRINGIDELPQILNILRGEMSVVGRRPLLTDEYSEQYDIVGSDREGAKLVDRHRATAGIAKPGMLSTHAIHAHQGDESIINLASRLELDIYDFENASEAHTLELLRTVLSSMRHGELQRGSIRLTDSGLGNIL
ncbi:MAG: sugar transferase [Candidatus Saccharibacteria bacterium]|nr:sugar transferase [Candidatus Saccharibacteria bacterium]